MCLLYQGTKRTYSEAQTAEWTPCSFGCSLHLQHTMLMCTLVLFVALRKITALHRLILPYITFHPRSHRSSSLMLWIGKALASAALQLFAAITSQTCDLFLCQLHIITKHMPTSSLLFMLVEHACTALRFKQGSTTNHIHLCLLLHACRMWSSCY